MASGITLFTIGHGTSPLEPFLDRLRAASIRQLVDVRRFPGSRHNPQYGHAALAEALLAAGIRYQHAPELGGRRRPSAESANLGLRVAAFRAYADYMETSDFAGAFECLMAMAREETTIIMCSETLWWRCHRRLIADASVLIADCAVMHLVGKTVRPHVLTAGVTRQGEGLRYLLEPGSV